MSAGSTEIILVHIKRGQRNRAHFPRSGVPPWRQGFFDVIHGVEKQEVSDAVLEEAGAARRVIDENVTIDLRRNSRVLRKLQHRVMTGHHLAVQSLGGEPQRHLVISPETGG